MTRMSDNCCSRSSWLFGARFNTRLTGWTPWQAAADSNFAMIFIVDVAEFPFGFG